VWIARGEAFSVYFGLFARISPWTWRDGRLGLRKPLSGLAGFKPLPGSVLALAMMIGTVSFDGAAEAPIWTKTVPHVADAFRGSGSPRRRRWRRPSSSACALAWR